MSTVTPIRPTPLPSLDEGRLSEEQLERILQSIKLRWSTYIPKAHSPLPQQYAFLSLPHREAFYGGAAGGGKSDCLLMGALQYVDVPGYAALLIRRTYADLMKPGALIPRSHEWLDATDAHWDGMNKQWRFPSGAYLDFGYLENDNDVYKYQSSQYQYIGFDELPQFNLFQYRYLFSRIRRLAGSEIPARMRSAGNPSPQRNHWTFQRFIVSGEKARAFIPARLEDNPYLDQEDYDLSLRELDPITYQQLRWGRWDIAPPGQFFQREWFKIIQQPPAGARPIRMWDLAATKNQSSAYTAGALLSITGGRLCVHHMRRVRGNPGEVEATVLQQAQLDGRGIPVHMEQEPGSGGVNTIFRYRHSVLSGWAFHEYLPRHDKLTRASPLSALARAGGIDLVEGPWLETFLDELCSFPEGFKDQVDTCSAGLQVLTQRPIVRLTSL